jgi:hypothetical protein
MCQREAKVLQQRFIGQDLQSTGRALQKMKLTEAEVVLIGEGPGI